MLIRDLVTLDDYVGEHSVVQIEFFSEREKNRHLVNSFIFTRHAPEKKRSSLEMLYRLYQSACTDALENIFCLIANYGHGKSHFGVILANFFGQPWDSDEFRTLLNKIEHSGEEPAIVRSYEQFRQSRAPYLVIRLRGDDPYPLDQQFLNAVRRALEEQDITTNLPLWYDVAARWLSEKVRNDPNTAERADQILRDRYNTDLPMLIQRVQEYDHSTYATVRELHQHLYGTLPDFEGSLGAHEILDWLVKHYCREEARFGGVLILFDEFAAFLHNYARLPERKLGTLQRFLEAVDRHRRDVLFVAFAQIDPHTVIDTESHGSIHDELVRELQRIPASNKLLLHSRLELVIDAFLKQNEQVWNELRREHPGFNDQLFDATYLTMELFDRVYSNEMAWTPEQFETVVTQGCFPLHPLTTAILCNAGLGGEQVQSDTPRTVLGFVMQAVRNSLDEQVYHDSRPNWILPVSLVDYFEGMLPDREYQQYLQARKLIEGVPTPEQEAVLKAILLIASAQIPVRRDNFISLVSHLSGYDKEVVKSTLNHLADERVLYDDRGVYRFWETGGDRQRLVQLREAVKSEPLTEEDVERLCKRNKKFLEVSVSWGGKDDWVAKEEVLWRKNFSVDHLRRLAPKARVDGREISVSRGLLVRLVALSEDDVQWFQQNAERIVDEAFAEEHPPAVMVLVPTSSHEETLKNLRWLDSLNSSISEQDRQRIGEQMLRSEQNQLEADLRREIEHGLLSDSIRPAGNSMGVGASLTNWKIVVPKAYRHGLGAVRDVADGMRQLYRLVYSAVPAFFTQYDHKTTKLRRDVCQIGIKLADNRLCEIIDTLGNGPGKDCVEKFLIEQWKVVHRSYYIQEPPSDSKVKQAWNVLDNAFRNAREAVRVQDVLLKLMDPPYGYHYHQLALLFSAWCGYYKRNLRVSVDGRQSTIGDLWKENGVDRSERFLENLIVHHNVTLGWVDHPDVQIVSTAQQILSGQINLSVAEAQRTLAELQGYMEEGENTDERDLVKKASELLEEHLRKAQDYDQQAQELESLLGENKLDPLVEKYTKLALPELGIVKPNSTATPVDLKRKLLQKIRDLVERDCQRAENLKDITSVDLHINFLKSKLLQQVKQVGVQELIQRVNDAIKRTQERATKLKLERKEQAIATEIDAMNPDASLARLYEYLDRLAQFSPQTEGVRDRHESKKQQIEQAIKRHQARLEEWEIRFTSHSDDLEDLQHLRDEILRYVWVYQGTNEQKQVEKLQTRCAARIAELRAEQDYESLLQQVRRINDREKLERLRSLVEELLAGLL